MRSTWPRILWPKTASLLLHQLKLTAAADLALHIDEKTEQKEHISILLSFYKNTRMMAIAAAKAVEEMAVKDAVADAAADEAGTAVAMADPWPANFSQQ